MQGRSGMVAIREIGGTRAITGVRDWDGQHGGSVRVGTGHHVQRLVGTQQADRAIVARGLLHALHARPRRFGDGRPLVDVVEVHRVAGWDCGCGTVVRAGIGVGAGDIY
jgi:hypothetical protein